VVAPAECCDRLRVDGEPGCHDRILAQSPPWPGLGSKPEGELPFAPRVLLTQMRKLLALVREELKGHARPGRGPATGTRAGPGLTDEGGEDSIGVGGVGGVVARDGFAEVRRCQGGEPSEELVGFEKQEEAQRAAALRGVRSISAFSKFACTSGGQPGSGRRSGAKKRSISVLASSSRPSRWRERASSTR
jgi:hypothetical protein